MIRGIHHTAIATLDLDRLLDFYVGLVGLQLLGDFTWQDDARLDTIVGLPNTKARSVFLDAGNTFLEFFQYHSPEPVAREGESRPCDPAITHVCFDVVEVEQEYARLSAAGVRFVSPPQRKDNVHTCYARDPDGNLVEFQELVSPRSRLQLPEFRQKRETSVTT